MGSARPDRQVGNGCTHIVRQITFARPIWIRGNIHEITGFILQLGRLQLQRGAYSEPI